VAGIAAMVLTGILGTAMGLNNTATFMSSCVAFVAVAMWMDSRIARRRREAARNAARQSGSGPSGSGPSGSGSSGSHQSGQSAPGSDASAALDSETPERDGRGS
jgi:hypothetical protein